MILYHGGTDIVNTPEIRTSLIGRDFGKGFYCTDVLTQAEKWAKRQSRVRNQRAILNIYEFDKDTSLEKLNYKIFENYGLEWLEMVIKCRKDLNYNHGFDIVYGKIANDDVGETVQAVLDGLMPMDFALEKLVFMPANNQYCFCNDKALSFLNFTESKEL